MKKSIFLLIVGIFVIGSFAVSLPVDAQRTCNSGERYSGECGKCILSPALPSAVVCAGVLIDGIANECGDCVCDDNKTEYVDGQCSLTCRSDQLYKGNEPDGERCKAAVVLDGGNVQEGVAKIGTTNPAGALQSGIDLDNRNLKVVGRTRIDGEGDIYLNDGKAIRVDSISDTNLFLGNYQSGGGSFKLNVSGDITSEGKIQGIFVDSSGAVCTDGQILKRSTGRWTCLPDSGGVVYSAARNIEIATNRIKVVDQPNFDRLTIGGDSPPLATDGDIGMSGNLYMLDGSNIRIDKSNVLTDFNVGNFGVGSGSAFQMRLNSGDNALNELLFHQGIKDRWSIKNGVPSKDLEIWRNTTDWSSVLRMSYDDGSITAGGDLHVGGFANVGATVVSAAVQTGRITVTGNTDMYWPESGLKVGERLEGESGGTFGKTAYLLESDETAVLSVRAAERNLLGKYLIEAQSFNATGTQVGFFRVDGGGNIAMSGDMTVDDFTATGNVVLGNNQNDTVTVDGILNASRDIDIVQTTANTVSGGVEGAGLMTGGSIWIGNSTRVMRIDGNEIATNGKIYFQFDNRDPTVLGGALLVRSDNNNTARPTHEVINDEGDLRLNHISGDDWGSSNKGYLIIGAKSQDSCNFACSAHGLACSIAYDLGGSRPGSSNSASCSVVGSETFSEAQHRAAARYCWCQ